MACWKLGQIDGPALSNKAGSQQFACWEFVCDTELKENMLPHDITQCHNNIKSRRATYKMIYFAWAFAKLAPFFILVGYSSALKKKNMQNLNHTLVDCKSSDSTTQTLPLPSSKQYK